MKIVDYIKGRKKFRLKIDGVSMLPLLKNGDVLFFRQIKFNKLRLNDIIIAQKGNIIFVHRIIYLGQSYVITKGDNSIVSDGRLYEKNIIAKAYQLKREDQTIDIDNIYLLQSSSYFQEIQKIKHKLEAADINFVFLKGLPLHLYFEKKHPRRIYADCDLLIEKSQWKKVLVIFKKNGYFLSDTSYSVLHRKLKDKPTEFVFVKSIKGLTIQFDIHLEVVFLFNQIGKIDHLYRQQLIDSLSNTFLHEKISVKVDSERYPILSRSNLIVYLALHFFHHNFLGIYRLEFLDTVARDVISKSDAREIFHNCVSKIKLYQLTNIVYPVFLLLEKYYHTPLSKDFLKSIKPNGKALEYIEKNILAQNIFDEQTRFNAGVTRFKHIFYLSPNTLPHKILVFFTPSVFYSFFWVAMRKIVKAIKLFFGQLTVSRADLRLLLLSLL